MALRNNVVANYVGQGWRAVMSLAFVPLYIKYLGIEAYGLIGIFALLQAWLSLVDLGMKPVLGREMARFTGGAHDPQSIWDLLRSIEIIAIVVGIVVAIGIWVASDWLAADWVHAQKLPVAQVARAFQLMGAIIGLQLIESMYTSSIAGLQRQVLQNVVVSSIATVRGLGAVAILIWVSPTITAFFLWQGVISLATATIFAVIVYRVLPSTSRPAHFSKQALSGVWRYAAGMVGINLLSLILTQVDKVVLSRLLSLQAFAYYALAGVVSGGLYTLTGPVTTAFYPRFTELAMLSDKKPLAEIYHQGAQLVSVLTGSAAVVLMAFADRVLLLWTADPTLTQQVVPLLRILVLGTTFNTLLWIPYQLQLAHGWTSLPIKVNTVAVCILVPAILWVVPIYGAIGAAWIWVFLNTGYLIFGIYFMHRRLLPNEKWRWYGHDVAIPLAAASVTGWLCRWAMPANQGRLGELLVIVLSSCLVLAAAAASAPAVRTRLARNVSWRLPLHDV